MLLITVFLVPTSSRIQNSWNRGCRVHTRECQMLCWIHRLGFRAGPLAPNVHETPPNKARRCVRIQGMEMTGSGDGGGAIGAQRHQTRVKASKAYGNLGQQQREPYG